MKNIDIGKNIKHLRKKNKITQVELAERTGIRQGTISAIETGTNQPTIDTAITIAEALNCSLSELVYGEEEKLDRLNVVEKGLVCSFRKLNNKGKLKILETAEDCLLLPKYKAGNE